MIISPKDNTDSGFLSGKSLQIDLVTKSDVEQANWLLHVLYVKQDLFSGMWDRSIDIVKANFIGYN